MFLIVNIILDTNSSWKQRIFFREIKILQKKNREIKLLPCNSRLVWGRRIGWFDGNPVEFSALNNKSSFSSVAQLAPKLEKNIREIKILQNQKQTNKIFFFVKSKYLHTLTYDFFLFFKNSFGMNPTNMGI